MAEAQLAIRHGTAALELVSAMPSVPGVIEKELTANSLVYPSLFFCVASTVAGSAS